MSDYPTGLLKPEMTRAWVGWRRTPLRNLCRGVRHRMAKKIYRKMLMANVPVSDINAMRECERNETVDAALRAISGKHPASVDRMRRKSLELKSSRQNLHAAQEEMEQLQKLLEHGRFANQGAADASIRLCDSMFSHVCSSADKYRRATSESVPQSITYFLSIALRMKAANELFKFTMKSLMDEIDVMCDMGYFVLTNQRGSYRFAIETMHENKLSVPGSKKEVSFGVYSIVLNKLLTAPIIKLDIPNEWGKLALNRRDHPHTNGGYMCYGNRREAIEEMGYQGFILPRMEITRSALDSYIPESSYSRLSEMLSMDICRRCGREEFPEKPRAGVGRELGGMKCGTCGRSGCASCMEREVKCGTEGCDTKMCIACTKFRCGLCKKATFCYRCSLMDQNGSSYCKACVDAAYSKGRWPWFSPLVPFMRTGAAWTDRHYDLDTHKNKMNKSGKEADDAEENPEMIAIPPPNENFPFGIPSGPENNEEDEEEYEEEYDEEYDDDEENG